MIIRHGRAVSQGKQGLFWGVSSPAVSCEGTLVGCPLRPLRGHSRLPARVMQPSGLRPSPTEAAAETKR